MVRTFGIIYFYWREMRSSKRTTRTSTVGHPLEAASAAAEEEALPSTISSTGRKRKAVTGEDSIKLVDVAAYKPGLFYPSVREPDAIGSIREDLDQLGFAVVGNILNSEESTEFTNKFWGAMMKRVPLLKQDDPSTWTEENTVWRGQYGAGQFKHYGMAQEEHCWLIRKNKLIRKIYEEMFGEECCVSIDGAAALFAPAISNLKMHVDLVPDLPGYDFGSIQGSYNVYPVEVQGDKYGAGFVCVPESHKLYEEMWSRRKAEKGFTRPRKHWHILEPDSELQSQGVLIVSPANSLILWDSKLLHKNYGGDFTVAELSSNRPTRMTQFIAWQPKRVRTTQVLQRKRNNVLLGRCGNHWAAAAVTEPVKPFPAWGKHIVKTILPFAGLSALPEEIEEIL